MNDMHDEAKKAVLQDLVKHLQGHDGKRVPHKFNAPQPKPTASTPDAPAEAMSPDMDPRLASILRQKNGH